jgi:hypothetical protein
MAYIVNSHDSARHCRDAKYAEVFSINRNSYTLKGDGPMTLAACAPGSLYDAYVTRLGDVVTFAFDGDNLILNLKIDAGAMVFAKAE